MTSALTPDPDLSLADGFADRIVHWSREAKAPAHTRDALHAAARAVSLATTAGHVCTYLADMAPTAACPDVASLRTRLLASRMVGTREALASTVGAVAYPLILDDEDRLYLHRYFDYEQRLARRLTQASPTRESAVDPQLSAILDRLFDFKLERLGEGPDWQKIATAMALLNRLTLVSGGPGTGKTTTVVNILACAIASDPNCRIALAAPTGKAAARMLDAIRGHATRLPAELAARLPAAAYTVHRLLEVMPGNDRRFRHHAGNRLAIDLLVVDEASMLDLALATQLLDAVPPSAHIVLLGDKDQLAAVESGAVFSELSADPTLTAAGIHSLSEVTGIPAARLRSSAPIKPTGLHDSVVWLTENFRFAADSAIARLAALVNRGDAAGAIDYLRAPTDTHLEWINDASADPESATLQRIVDGMSHYLDAARADLSNPAALFDALGAFRVLCAERRGRRGVDAINELVARHFRRSLDHPQDPGPRSEWYPGRPVMVLANDYVQKLFNGDVGIILPDASGTMMASFPQSDGGFRIVAPLRLPRHETAFATTVHKAQGSEFDRVLLMLPARASRVVTRELLYTAITRARRGVTIAGSAEVIETAILSPTRRYSGLIARLAEAQASLEKAS